MQLAAIKTTANERHCMSKARDTKKQNDKKKLQNTLKEKRQVKREKKSVSPGG
jgi:hypothetical protein